MNRFFLYVVIIVFLSTTVGIAQVIHLKSPNGKIDMALESGAKISWFVKHENTEVIAPSSSLWFCNIKNITGDNVVGYAETHGITE